MKKAVLIILSLALVLAVLSGCASNNSPNNSQIGGNSKRTINGSLKSFKATTLGGGSFSNSDFAKYDLTVINFWGTYCGPCINEMPELAKFKNGLPSNINFITYCVDAQNNENTVKSILGEAGLSATVIIAADGDFSSVLKQIQYIPTTLFIDSEGNIVGTEIIGGVSNLEETYNAHVDEALSQS